MKKVVLSLLAFGLIGAGAFAQAAPAAPTVTIGDWGRQLFVFGGQSASPGYWTSDAASWGGSPRIVGLNIQAKTDNAGFSITPSDDGGTFGLTDQNKAWINPLPGLQFEAGIELETDTWRGADDYGAFDWLRFNKEKGDSITFARLGEAGQEFDVNYNKDGVGGWFLVQNTNAYNGSTVNDDLGSNVQAGAAYTFPSIGMLKAQYLGYNVVNYGVDGGTTTNAAGVNGNYTVFGTPIKGTAGEFGTVQAAFNLTSVKDLYEELGIQIPTSSSDAGYSFQLTDSTSYKVDKVTYNLQVLAVDYTGDNGGTSGFALGGGVGGALDLGNSVTANVDIRYESALAANGGVKPASNNDAFTGVQVGLTKGFSNGLIGIAFEYSSDYGFSTGNGSSTGASWVIPVRLEEWF